LNFPTHIEMAKTLYRQLSDHIDLDLDAFIYGNIKPDCTPKVLLVPHVLSNHLDTVLDLAEKLINEEWTRSAFSEMLGEFCHYLCDFYCFYHAKEDKFHRLISHWVYEARLEKHLKRMTDIQSIFSFHQNPIDDLKAYIFEKHESYLSEKHTFELDLFYAYRVCKVACESIAYYATKSYVYYDIYEAQPALLKAGGFQ